MMEKNINTTDVLSDLIYKLRYLETPECRNLMNEEDRIKERQHVTENFRNALRIKSFLKNQKQTEFDWDLYK